jgi:hypothetical protein
MKNIQNKIEDVIYGYSPAEFMPIFRDGELANRREFIAYKLRSLVRA